MKKVLFACFIFNIVTAQAQFIGQGGVYYLGSANVPVSTANFSNPDIEGVVVRFRWNDTEPTPGNFDWTFVDAEIAKAVTYNKKISLQPLGIPDWLDSIGAEQFYYIDKNPLHSTYGQIVSGILSWDSVYINRYKIFLQQLANKYAGDTTVSYVNAIAVAVSRNLPDTVVTDTTLMIQQPFWTAFNYNADTLAALMDSLTDYYMTLFPNTPLWCSVDYVKFEYNASMHPINYLASLYTNYGVTNYPGRFGLFREDLSGCNPPPVINSGSHWYIMQQHPCRTGAQMLWSVQDGPTRMNQCNMVPNTKSFVLDSAIQHGLTLGIRYMEIYGSDIQDASLNTVIANGNDSLIAKANQCNATTPVFENINDDFQVLVYPNPAKNILTVELQQQNFSIEILDVTGRKIFSMKNVRLGRIEIDCKDFPHGIYFLQVNSSKKIITEKIILNR